MEAFYEQNLINNAINEHSRRTRIWVIVSKILWGLGIAILIVFAVFAIAVKNFIYLLIGAGFCVPFILPAFLLGVYIKKTNCEYDYILAGDTLRIVCVMRRLKRKLVETIPLSSVVTVGSILSESYEKNLASKDIKKKYAICDYEAVDKIAYILYRSNGEKIMTHIEPDEGLIAALRKCLPRVGVVDKSLYTQSNGGVNA